MNASIYSLQVVIDKDRSVRASYSAVYGFSMCHGIAWETNSINKYIIKNIVLIHINNSLISVSYFKYTVYTFYVCPSRQLTNTGVGSLPSLPKKAYLMIEEHILSCDYVLW